MHCINCRYDLSQTEPDGRCPECGLAVAESTGPARAWTVRRLVVARWMLRSVGLFAVGILVVALVQLFASGLDLHEAEAVVAGWMIISALTVMATLVAAILAWIVARMGPPDEGPLRMVVPLMVVLAGAAFGLCAAVAGVLVSGVIAGGAFDSMWPIVVIDVLAAAGFIALQLAPLLAARLARSCSPAARAGDSWIVVAIWVVILAGIVGIGLRAVRLLTVPFAVAADDPSLATARAIELVGAAVGIACMGLVLAAVIRLGRAIDVRLAVVRLRPTTVVPS